MTVYTTSADHSREFSIKNRSSCLRPYRIVLGPPIQVCHALSVWAVEHQSSVKPYSNYVREMQIPVILGSETSRVRPKLRKSEGCTRRFWWYRKKKIDWNTLRELWFHIKLLVPLWIHIRDAVVEGERETGTEFLNVSEIVFILRSKRAISWNKFNPHLFPLLNPPLNPQP